ncbi:Hypothetical protein NG00_00769 [Corynebacterium camporealensis]|uniref:Uncharacterized protein n=1 Tax=Corynebacterium camporealensis TaxID=161896 RepID=A0A0F6QXS4_9CORY|nr:hypothetical protein [Corynebacterium camporealensis]AKE38828.1 hypothetical protein UL81_04275 [Corynebacterium camporealensis]AVH88095.1 Hypothetical protein NG00_00769 [Corynebacterium camporealensis]MDY5839557.1 hypothetical protein [Corynebacterium camporealensis]
MSSFDSLADVYFLAQAATDGPMGPEFGKASPIGLLILVLMLVAVLMAGWNFHRRYSRFRRRTMFAEDHGIDPFDDEAIDKAMKEAGIYDRRKRSVF